MFQRLVPNKKNPSRQFMNQNTSVTLPTLELRKVNNGCNDLPIVTILGDHCSPPPLPKRVFKCAVCRKLGCQQHGCVELHSFGLSVTKAKCLEPGDHFVWKTNLEMSAILDGTQTEPRQFPLEMNKDNINNEKSLSDTTTALFKKTFPVIESASTPHAKENLQKKGGQHKGKRGESAKAVPKSQ